MSQESSELGIQYAEAVLGRILLSPEWLPPGTRVDRWEVVARLGQGDTAPRIPCAERAALGAGCTR